MSSPRESMRGVADFGQQAGRGIEYPLAWLAPLHVASGVSREALESWEVSVKILFRVTLVLWLASGVALHAYFTRVATPAVERETQQLRQLAQSGEDQKAAFHRAGELWADLRMKQVRATAIWGLVGFVLALRGVNLLFRKADQVADVEKFLATSLVLAVIAGGQGPSPSAVDGLGVPVASPCTRAPLGNALG
jgi:hypothetical protein